MQTPFMFKWRIEGVDWFDLDRDFVWMQVEAGAGSQPMQSEKLNPI